MNKQKLINKLEKSKYNNHINKYELGFDKGIEFALYHIEDLEKNDNTPPHYQGTIQPIDLINEQNLNFNLGNVVKYVCRAGKKQGENILADLEKAKEYINFEIERVKQ